jgi:hypothetical protein
MLCSSLPPVVCRRVHAIIIVVLSVFCFVWLSNVHYVWPCYHTLNITILSDDVHDNIIHLYLCLQRKESMMLVLKSYKTIVHLEMIPFKLTLFSSDEASCIWLDRIKQWWRPCGQNVWMKKMICFNNMIQQILTLRREQLNNLKILY